MELYTIVSMEESFESLHLAPVLELVDGIAMTDVVWLKQRPKSITGVRELIYG
jgi:hypothetical protein